MKNFINKFSSNSLARGSAVVFMGSMTANIAAYLYHLLVGRILGPVGYGELSSLISLLYIFGVPTLVLQTMLVRYFSIAKAHDSLGEARYLFQKVMKAVIVGIGIFGILLSLSSPLVMSFLHLSRLTMVFWVFGIFAFSTLYIVPISITQGFQWFIWFGLLSALPGLLKLGISIPFSYQGVEWTLIAFVLSSCISFLVSLVPLKRMFRVKPISTALTKIKALKDAVPTLLALIGMTSLYSTDIVLVRHFFSSELSGIYAALAVLGKIIFYATSVVTMIVYPILSERKERKASIKDIMVKAYGVVLLVGVGLTLCYTAFPSFITHLLFGASYNTASQYLGLFAVFMSLYSLAYTGMMMFLALGKLKVWIFPLGAAVLQIIGILMFHNTFLDVIKINIFVSVLLVFSLLGFYTSQKQVYE